MDLCGDEYAEQGDFDNSLKDCLKGMIVSDLKGYTEKTLMDEVERQRGPRMLVPGWLKEHNLRRYLDGYVSPTVLKKAKSGDGSGSGSSSASPGKQQR